MVSSAYLKLLTFLSAVLIPACASSSPVFLMMYSAYKLNKLDDNIQPWQYTFSYLEPVCCSMSSSNCCFLTCIQVSQEAGQVTWYCHLFLNFPSLLWSTQSVFGTVNKSEIDVFLELLLFRWSSGCWQRSLVLLPFLKSAWTSGSSRFMYCWSLAWRILSITLLACEMSAIVQ